VQKEGDAMESETNVVFVPGRHWLLLRIIRDALNDCGYPGMSEELIDLLCRDVELLAAMQRLVFRAMSRSREVEHEQ
jgi:hypothetical protein